MTEEAKTGVQTSGAITAQPEIMLGSLVDIVIGGEVAARGEVDGITNYRHAESSYYVMYIDKTGVPRGEWLGYSKLKPVLAGSA